MRDFIEHDVLKYSSHWTIAKIRYLGAGAFAYISIRPFLSGKGKEWRVEVKG